MSTKQGVSTPDATGTEATNLLKRNSVDVGWEYGVLVDASNKDKVKCKLCDKEMRGGIHRLKEHLTHEGKNVKKCTARTPHAMEAKEKCKKALADAKRKREEKTVRELEIREEVHVSRVGTDSDEVTCVGSLEPHKLGPIDKWTRAIDPKATKSDSLKQQQLNKELWKERTNEVHKYIARWACTHGIAFNACDNDEFKQMCEAIEQFGLGLVPPTQDALRGKLLEEEYERTKSLLQEREAEKMKNGCSIMTDAWSNRKRRSIMNLCTNCADGTSFISSKEMSHVSHTSEVIFDLVDKAIKEIGLDNVVQVLTDNASNNMGAKRLLEEKRPHIFWTSCATHTINLMLQGIGNMTRFKKVVDQAKAFTIFVYGHTRTLECLRYFTEGKEKGKEATATILTPSFWKDVKLTLTVFEPLVKVLRLVDGDVRPSMGFLYGELLKAKRQIKEAFGNVEARFKDVIAIIDKKMNGRLDSPLHLIAYLLNPHYSYSDPSIFDQPKISEGFIACVEKFYYHDEDMQHQAANIELKKFQNREGPFNKKLARTFKNFDYNPDGEEDEMEGIGIPWSVIGEAVGANEQLELRRSARVRELYEGEEFESEEEEYDDEDVYYSEEEI
ncbi:unnamed protein product [Miscanthus lutarioriparius]|uniref:BED-type domain-containing protein n=1 Tax=Miscanthus lutarioriparius TaxID=422564 RepID=A0A811NAQ1_9POAL|nr:unnamed protein product [Miscanthus lutarioriparius]